MKGPSIPSIRSEVAPQTCPSWDSHRSISAFVPPRRRCRALNAARRTRLRAKTRIRAEAFSIRGLEGSRWPFAADAVSYGV